MIGQTQHEACVFSNGPIVAALYFHLQRPGVTGGEALPIVLIGPCKIGDWTVAMIQHPQGCEPFESSDRPYFYSCEAWNLPRPGIHVRTSIQAAITIAKQLLSAAPKSTFDSYPLKCSSLIRLFSARSNNTCYWNPTVVLKSDLPELPCFI